MWTVPQAPLMTQQWYQSPVRQKGTIKAADPFVQRAATAKQASIRVLEEHCSCGLDRGSTVCLAVIVIPVRMNIGWIESWSKRKGLGADLVRKYEDSETKICLPQSQKLGTARASIGTAVPPSRVTFAAFT
ncbi:hypothetical protein MTR_7g079660 [Medicago truncatula]|uniref:Uncharacterized protein n=1 Tax=Medicago truncatula TaxID=3880 RepID=G7KQM9_MEDTR|nr:hypothetical protein MTR_7g079660 [Medicago truncatula]